MTSKPMEIDAESRFLMGVKSRFLFKRNQTKSAERIEKQISLGCNPLDVYLCELRRLVRRTDNGISKHPERLIGGASAASQQSQSIEDSVSAQLLMLHLLDNEKLMIELVVQKAKKSVETCYFFLDLIHCLCKQNLDKQGACGKKPNKRKREEIDTKKMIHSVLLMVKTALFLDNGGDHCSISLLRSSVSVQLLYKASSILSFLVTKAFTDETVFKECVDTTCLVVRSVLRDLRNEGAEGKGSEVVSGGCSLVERRAMMEPLPARLFSMLNVCVNEALKRDNSELVDTCSTLVRELLSREGGEEGRSGQSLFSLLRALTESDDDLIEALLTLTEICLRLETPSVRVSSLPQRDLWSMYTLSPLSTQVSTEHDAPSLPIMLFLWFTQWSLCADEGVLVDLLLNPETKALEYCLRCTRLLASTAQAAPLRPQLQSSLQYITCEGAYTEREAAAHKERAKEVLEGGGTTVVWSSNDSWDRVASCTWRGIPRPLDSSPLNKDCFVDDVTLFLQRLCSALDVHASSLRAAEALVERISGVLASLA